MIDFVFVKSSHSTSGGECVEVARNIPGTVAVRDSKDLTGPILCVTSAAWGVFTATVQAQEEAS
ncbi:DUF397 domain-containing protein [Streptomyces scopuliridis]